MIRSLVVGLTVAVLVGGCGSDGGKGLAPPFSMTVDEISPTVDPAVGVATNVNTGLDQGDVELYQEQFASGARVIDPIVPSLQPSVLGFFGSFRSLCTSWEMDEVFVNGGGALSVGYCQDFFAPFEEDADEYGGGLPDGLPAVRHLPIEDGLAVELMHRLHADTVEEHPEGVVLVIGFPVERASDVTSQVVIARTVLAQFEEAWEGPDLAAVAELYADDAVRHDAYVGELVGTGAVGDWMDRLLDAYPDLEVTVESLYASGRGPGLIYRLSMTDDGVACEMRLASVFDLSEAGQINSEFVYYHPDSLFACDWAA